jgi:hypothetical protein
LPAEARRGVAIALGNFAIFNAIGPGFVAGCADAPPLAKISNGTRVVFAEAWDIFPECIVPAGSTATVTENGLNELACACIVTPDDPALRTALAQWGRRHLADAAARPVHRQPRTGMARCQPACAALGDGSKS